MSRGTILADIRRRIAEDEETNSFFKNEKDLYPIINWALPNVIMDVWPWIYLRVQEIDTVEDSGDYTSVTNDILTPMACAYGDPDSTEEYKILAEMSLDTQWSQYSQRSLAGRTPESWCLAHDGSANSQGKKLILIPAAHATYAPGIKFLYLIKPTTANGLALTSSGSEAGDQSLEDCIGALGAYRCFLMSGGQDRPRGKDALAEYNWLKSLAKKKCGIPEDYLLGAAWTYDDPFYISRRY